MNDAVYLVTTKPDGPFYGMAKDHEARAKAYCEKWRIEYFHDCIENLDGFTKIDCAKRLFEGNSHFKYVFLMDADSMVVDFETDLREALPDNCMVGMSMYPVPWGQWLTHYQAGNIYLKNTDRLVYFLNTVLLGRSPGVSEQCVINDLFFGETRYQPRVSTLSHHWNSIQHFAPSDKDIVASWHGAHDGQTRRLWMQAFAKAHPYPGQA